MKYNNFLITLTLCVGFSSATTWTMEADPTAKGQPNPRWWHPSQMLTSAKAAYNSFTVENMKKQMSKWAPSKLQALFLAVVGALLAVGYINKDTLKSMIEQEWASMDPSTRLMVKGLGGTTAAAAAGTTFLGVNQYRKYVVYPQIAKELIEKYITPNEPLIENAIHQATPEFTIYEIIRPAIKNAKEIIENRINTIVEIMVKHGHSPDPTDIRNSIEPRIKSHNEHNIINQLSFTTKNETERKVLRAIYNTITR